MKKLLWVSSMAVGVMLVAQGCVLDPTYTDCLSSSECGVGEDCVEVSTDETEGAFCTQACTSDAQCERNLGFRGACMVAGPDAICFQECDFNSDCFSSSGCWDYTDADGSTNRVCLPERLWDPTYTYCLSSSECGVGEDCFEVSTDATDGAFCSQACTSDAQCERNLGFRGACMVSGLDASCFQECDFNSDCFSSSGCWDYTDADGFTNRVCLPERL